GAAFSFLGDQDGWQRWFFIALAWGVSLALVIWLSKTELTQRRLILGLTLVLGGAIGNVIDRMVYHHVVDFLDFYWGVWHYPTFNVADIAISVGAVLLIWDAWKSDKA
ncbi:MAG TPA: signal peptidase II, partial [Thiotrichales bacterium]|nr:signal peptidase II [Thiotrichales bacterium]